MFRACTSAAQGLPLVRAAISLIGESSALARFDFPACNVMALLFVSPVLSGVQSRSRCRLFKWPKIGSENVRIPPALGLVHPLQQLLGLNGYTGSLLLSTGITPAWAWTILAGSECLFSRGAVFSRTCA